MSDQQQHHRKVPPEVVQEGLGAGQGLHSLDDALDVGQPDPVLPEDLQPVPHELVVVGDIPRGQPEVVVVEVLGDRDPDFRQEDALQV